MTFLLGLGLLASAFSPLLVALWLVAHPLAVWWGNALVAVGLALPMLLLIAVLRSARKLADQRVAVRSATPKDSDQLSFLAASLVPVAIAFFTPDPLRFVAMIVLLVLLAAVYVRAELFWLNPVLAIAGFRVYQVVDDDSGITYSLITRRRIVRAGGRVDGKLIAHTVIVELGGKNDGST